MCFTSTIGYKESRGVTGSPGTTCPRKPFLTLSWTPGAEEHQGRGGWIGGGHGTLADPWWNLRDTFENPRRSCPRRPETPPNLKNFGETLPVPWWNLGGPAAQRFGSPRPIGPRRPDHHESCGTLVEPGCKIGTLAKPWWNLP